MKTGEIYMDIHENFKIRINIYENFQINKNMYEICKL